MVGQISAWVVIIGGIIAIAGTGVSVVRSLFRLAETIRDLTTESRRNTQAVTLLFRAYTNLADRVERVELNQERDRPTKR